MVHSRRRLCHSLIDQECLQHEIEEWKKGSCSTNIYFQPKGIVGSTDVNSAIENDLDSDDEKDDIRMEKRESTSLLFVYQTDWQKRLFARYGNELVLFRCNV